MGTLIPQTKYDVMSPGTYRVRLGAVAVEDGIYGTQVVMRFDVLDEEFAGRSVKAWAAAKLSGGRRPSKLYSWASALLFAGKPLPDGYDLDTDALRSREAWAVVEIIERDGVFYNRIVQLFPLRAASRGHGDAGTQGRGDEETRRQGDAWTAPEREGWIGSSSNLQIPALSWGDLEAEEHETFDEEPPW